MLTNKSFNWDLTREFRILLRTKLMRPSYTYKVGVRPIYDFNGGEFIVRTADGEHKITIVEEKKDWNLSWNVICESQSLRSVYKLLHGQRRTRAKREPREIIRPVLPEAIFDTLEETVFDFFEAIDGLETTKGFGNVGLLLFGPAGVGKSETMRWLKDVSFDKHGRDSHKLSYVQLEKLLSEGVDFNPDGSIIFIDDIDANILRDRKKENPHPLTSQFLTCLDGLDKREGRVIVISTNEPIEHIDPALVRPGRFDVTITFEYPTDDLIQQFCTMREIDLPPSMFTDWSFARIDMFLSRYRVAHYRHETPLNAFYEKFIHEQGEIDKTVEAYADVVS